jgi:hypothetical protein
MSALLTLEEAQARLLSLAPQTESYAVGLSHVATPPANASASRPERSSPRAETAS